MYFRDLRGASGCPLPLLPPQSQPHRGPWRWPSECPDRDLTRACAFLLLLPASGLSKGSPALSSRSLQAPSGACLGPLGLCMLPSVQQGLYSRAGPSVPLWSPVEGSPVVHRGSVRPSRLGFTAALWFGVRHKPQHPGSSVVPAFAGFQSTPGTPLLGSSWPLSCPTQSDTDKAVAQL